MAWNGSGKDQGGTQGQQKKASRVNPQPSSKRGIVAGVIVICLGSLVAFWLMRGDDKPVVNQGIHPQLPRKSDGMIAFPCSAFPV